MSVAGLAGLVLSVWLTARAWHTERAAALVLSPEETRIRRVALVVQRASGVCAAGLVTSILVLGLGGRLMMGSSPQHLPILLRDASPTLSSAWERSHWTGLSRSCFS